MGRGNTQPLSCPGSCWKFVSQHGQAVLVTSSTSVTHCYPHHRLCMGTDAVRDIQMEQIPLCPKDGLGHPPTNVPSSKGLSPQECPPSHHTSWHVPRRCLQRQKQRVRLPRRNFAWHAIF